MAMTEKSVLEGLRELSVKAIQHLRFATQFPEIREDHQAAALDACLKINELANRLQLVRGGKKRAELRGAISILREQGAICEPKRLEEQK
jgi:hypothetical protein